MGWLDTVKKFFTRETAGQVATLARGASGEGMMPRTLPLAPDSGMSGQYQQLATMLAVDSDLLLRYADYENMDESSGEISAALDIYADDATISDAVHGRIIWGTSKDKIVRDIINDLLERRIRIEEDIWTAIRTLTKYGNCFCEIVVNDKGVLGLNWLPPPTMRRIVDAQGHLVGFVQDPTGAFAFQLGTQEDLEKLRAPTGAAGGGTAVFFYPWEVVHWRLTGRQMRALYGFCERKTAKVTTALGVKEIQHLRPGDEVETFDGFQMRKTKVLDVVHSGTKKVFSIKTRHRENFATAEHPICVFVQNVGFTYKQVQNLEKGDCVVIPRPSEFPGRLVETKLAGRFDRVRLTELGVAEVRRVRGDERYFFENTGINDLNIDQVDQFCAGNVSISSVDFDRLSSVLPCVRIDGMAVTHSKNRENFVNCPRHIDKDFAWLFGLLLGDGWISHNQDVGIAVGLDKEFNDRIVSAVRKYGLEPCPRYQRVIDENTGTDERVLRQYVVHARDFVDLLHDLGFVNGAHNKRIPQWVYESPREIRESVLQGFVDADGWDVNQHGRDGVRIEVCNYDLSRDLKALIDGLGFTCGNICVRKPRTGEVSSHPAMRGKAIASGPGYILHFHTTPLFDGPILLERVISVIEQPTDPEDVYDIQVDAETHNFVADGMVVHNSVVESARWVWKRLMMLEDSSLVLKLCLHGDTLVWTPGGAQEIRNLEEGDDVFSYSPGGKLVKTQVVYKKHNGTDRLFRITSKHREIIANSTHPVLVEWFAGHGKGIPRTRFQEYVEVQNLKPGEHRFITPSIEDDVCDYVPLAMPDVGQKARLSPSSLSSVAMQFSPNILGSRCNVRPPFVTSFFAGEYEISIGVAIRLLRENGTSLDVLDVRDDWGGARPTLPVVADEDFARWFGFMIGDGWASERPSRQGSREYMVREIGFATGVDEAINAKYRALFERFFGPSRFAKSNKSPHENVGAVVISSKAAVEFMALNGFITGAHNKRIPQWVFKSPVSVRLAFMEGLADADGHTREMSVGDVHAKVRFERVTLEMCNRDLLEDVRLLCMQTGMVVGSVHSRDRKGGRTIAGNDKPLPDTQSHSLSYSFDRMPLSETIDSVEEVEQDDIWDIGVIADEHNFVANGVVVHNTKAPARFAFYVDTGELPPREARAMVDEVRRRYKKKRIVDTATGKLDFRMNPLENSEDFFIPTRAGKEASRIDVLAGPDYDDTNVLQYFLKKLYAALRIPPQYLGGQEATNRSALSMEDVQFARMEMRIQREFITGLNQVVRVHLAALNIDPDSVKWALRMAAPSSIFEMQQIEVWNARAGLAGALRDFFTMPWIIANIFHLSDDDALFATESKQNENEAEALKQAQIQADILQRYPELGAAPPALGEAVERKPDSRALAEGVRRDIRQIVQEVMPDNGEVLRRLGRIEPAVERLERRLSGVRR